MFKILIVLAVLLNYSVSSAQSMCDQINANVAAIVITDPNAPSSLSGVLNKKEYQYMLSTWFPEKRNPNVEDCDAFVQRKRNECACLADINNIFELKTSVLDMTNYPSGGKHAVCEFDNYITWNTVFYSKNCNDVDTTILEVSVSEVKLAQVVYNPIVAISTNTTNQYSPLIPEKSDNFTAVLGKSASFEVKVKLKGSSTTPPTGNYTVQIQDSNGVVVSQSPSLDNATLANPDGYTITADIMAPPLPKKSFVPLTLGQSSYKAIVINSKAEVKNIPKNITLTVLKTYTPSIGLVRIKSGDTTKYSSTDEASINNYLGLSSYLSAVLPVADQSLILTDEGSIDGNPIMAAAYTNDLLALDRKRRRLFMNRLVAIVPRPYIKSVYPNAVTRAYVTGYHSESVPKVAVVSNSYLKTFPHELGHSFAIDSELYNYGEAKDRVYDGYNADPSGYLNSTKVYSKARSFMDDADATSFSTMPWIDDRNYSILFHSLSIPIIDPKTILVTGILNKSGVLSDVKSYDLPNGVLTPSVQGDIKINSLDSTGKILNTLTVQSNFKIKVIGEPGYLGPNSIETELMPISVEIPADDGIASIQMEQNGKILLTTSIQGLKLKGLIERIPLDAFKAIGCNRIQDKAKFAQKEKDALLHIAATAQKLIDEKHTVLAKLSLEGLILTIKAFTNAKYYPADADSLSQSSVVSEIKLIIKSLDKKAPKGK